MDGHDLTKVDKRLTDAEIARHFPLDLFERAVFYGQTEVSALLEVRLAAHLLGRPSVYSLLRRSTVFAAATVFCVSLLCAQTGDLTLVPIDAA